MDAANASNAELLQAVLGKREAAKLTDMSLSELFAPTGRRNGAPRRFAAAKELLRRWLATELMDSEAIDEPKKVRDYLCLHFAGLEHEIFVVLFLNAQHRLLRLEEMFRGTLTQTSVYPREIVKRALVLNAAAVIFAHNHPSGIARASRADEALTQTLKTALALVDVKVLDHFVIAGSRATSFAEQGLL